MKLPESVKRFIELNIDFIEQNDWYKVFVNWYTNGDDYYFDDLVEAFEQAGIDILEQSKDVREEILSSIARSIFANLKLTNKKITFANLMSRLNSQLGFYSADWREVIDKAAAKEGLQITVSGWYRV